MTGNARQSYVICAEGFTADGKPNFGKGRGFLKDGVTPCPWIHVPPGTFILTQHSRSATPIYTAGSKVWDEVAYGAMSGSFEWTFYLDYNYLEPLWLAFDNYSSTEVGGKRTHVFTKSNNTRVPSFCIRRKILNRMAGGPDGSDEITELYGCVVRNTRFSKPAGNSQVSVTMTGFYVDEKMIKGNLESTDYADYDGKTNLAEFMCMFIGDVNDENYVANTETIELSIENGADPIYSTCSPFAQLYYEGKTVYEFSTTCYSNDPKKYHQRMYSGGYRNDVLVPQTKHMAPIEKINLLTYDKSIHDQPDLYPTFRDAINASDSTFRIELNKTVIKSMSWTKGDESKLMDTISSTNCRKMDMFVTNASNTFNMLDANVQNAIPGYTDRVDGVILDGAIKESEE